MERGQVEQDFVQEFGVNQNLISWLEKKKKTSDED